MLKHVFYTPKKKKQTKCNQTPIGILWLRPADGCKSRDCHEAPNIMYIYMLIPSQNEK